MSGAALPGPPDAGTLSPAIRAVCAGNAVVWLLAQPPWSGSGLPATASTLAGTALWAALAAGGNRPGRTRRITAGIAFAYLGSLVVKLVADALAGY